MKCAHCPYAVDDPEPIREGPLREVERLEHPVPDTLPSPPTVPDSEEGGLES